MKDAIWRKAAETFAPHIIRRSAGANAPIRPIVPLVFVCHERPSEPVCNR